MLHLTVEVPIRDGLILRGLHWAPEGPESAFAPVVLVLTPYGADRYHADGTAFAAAGFHLVSLDVRGRGDSDGRFSPFVHDGADGHDAVQWLAEQPWCSGDVVMYGGSYSGFTQWATAATLPPALRAIAPVASVYPGVDFPMAHNISKAHAARWLALTEGRRMNSGPFEDVALWRRAGSEVISRGLPFRDLDVMAVGRRLPFFQEWLDHPTLDDYWAAFVPRRQQYADIDIPVLTITGQYDDDQLGALTYHDQHLAAARPGTADRHQVVIGPWDHGGTRSGARSFGGLTFAASSAIDLRALHVEWYRWILGKADRPAFLRDRVAYFHVGENRWRSSPQVPGAVSDMAGPVERGSVLRLHPLADVITPGSHQRLLASKPPTAEQQITMVLDPRRASDPERDEPPAERTFTDELPLSDSNDGSTVHVSEPLTGPLDISGRFGAHLTLSTELPDFDVLVGVHLLPRDASPRLLGEAGLRARYRSSLRRPEPWPSGKPVRVDLGGFPFVSFRAEPGDRFALLIRPPHRRWQPNYQGGGMPADETVSDAVPGVVHIVQDPARPSYVTLPIVELSEEV
ncbi:CocE/NonD family hydrolase [Streptomyces brasiliensis]|uniref:Peptidase n=1 Tax=Streptomyces brasiliensis TaxID=1954 RepID=A0A917ULZ8_9ACTN|nr:CocE/NonD family hydrolase [Streptomyces brasiliensis]GGJ67760.1 putative peptidase [Streptomyces brasiliensis]